jgi:hypothetical protein
MRTPGCLSSHRARTKSALNTAKWSGLAKKLKASSGMPRPPSRTGVARYSRISMGRPNLRARRPIRRLDHETSAMGSMRGSEGTPDSVVDGIAPHRVTARGCPCLVLVRL